MEEKYIKKDFLTQKEKDFYNFLIQFESKYNIRIIPQVNLGTIVEKEKNINNGYRNELFKNIDFGVFDNEFNLLFLVEFNDKSHNREDRKERDNKVKKICSQVAIKLIPIKYSDFDNEKELLTKKIIANIQVEKEKLESNIKKMNNYPSQI